MSPKTDTQPQLLLYNNDGIALISSLLLTLLMSLVVLALAYRVELFSIGTRDRVVKNQNLYTADVGLNQARYFLLDKGCAMSSLDQWTCNGNYTIGSSYRRISQDFASTFLLPTTFTFTGDPANTQFGYDSSARAVTGVSSGAYSYNVYAKASGMQDVIAIMTVAEQPGNPAKTIIDAGLKFNTSLGDDSIRTRGQRADGSGNTSEALDDANSATVRNKIT